MLARVFELQVKNNPDKLAVVTREKKVTYDSLNRAANRAGWAFQAQLSKVGAETPGEMNKCPIVALLFQHGVDMITGTLGAVKAGKTYVPLDPNYPFERLTYILRHSEAALIATNTLNLALAERLAREITDQEIAILNIDAVDAMYGEENLNLHISGQEIAYLLYTSGSTGEPKGIIQTYENVKYYTDSYRENLRLTSEDRLTLFSAFSHDAAIMDIYSGLLSGATLYPLSIREINFPKLSAWLQAERITIYHSVPTVFRYWLQALTGDERFPDLRFIVLGGEGVLVHDVELFQKYFQANTVLMNLYGQSEASYNSSQYFTVDGALSKVTLGIPNAETEFWVVDDDGEEVQKLRVGEIVVVSDHVASGYWKDEQKTVQVFGENPDIGRFYRTGDLGRLLLDGSVEFVGRKDFQVKIRGFRVELGEIESNLLKHPLVQEAVVLAKDDELGNKLLVAFVVQKEPLTSAQLRAFLMDKLPEYMVPAQVKMLDRMPVMPNGKTDRKALLAMDLEGASANEYVAPATETEATIAGLLAKILGVERIGVIDNYFELGLHSLQAVTLVGKIYQSLNVEIPLRKILEAPTIRELAAYVDSCTESVYVSIKPVEKREYYPLSSAQRRLFVLDQLEGQTTNYNLPKALFVEGDLELARLQQAIEAVVRRHEALRTSFALVEGEPVQRIHDALTVEIEQWALPVSEEMDESLPKLMRDFIRPFDLRQAPLFRVGLAPLPNGYVLIFDLHHIIADGTSLGILTSDFLSSYLGQRVEPLRLQYKDYAVWQNELLESKTMRQQEEFWLKSLAGEIPVLNLPTDYARPAVMDFAGDSVTCTLAQEITASLREMALRQGATLYMTLLAAYYILLGKYSGQEDIVVGSPVAGRSHPELHGIIGMFVNTLAMRAYPERQKTFVGFLKEVKENAWQAYENQDYQFERLIDKLGLNRDLSRNPLFDVVFVLQNTESMGGSLPGLKFSPYEFAVEMVKFDLNLSAVERDEGIHFHLEYATKLFKRETVERMAGHLLNILRAVSAQPEMTLAEIVMISPAEQSLLLDGFNDTAANYRREATLHQLFEEQVARTPERVAVVFAGTSWTYRELNARANQLAYLLRERGVGPDQLVGVLIGRSLEMVAGILAVLKAGGAYLPIDPLYPPERISYILEDSGAKILLSEPLYSEQVEFTGEIIDVLNKRLGDEWGNLPNLNKPGDIAYVIYTSGSTGKPKGVMVEHRNVVRLMQNDRFQFDFSVQDVWTMFHSCCFDFSVWEMYGALLYGGKLVVVSKLTAQNPAEYLHLLKREGVTVLNQTPTAFYHLVEEEMRSPDRQLQLRYVIFGGEALKPVKLKAWHERYPETKLINMYGITETTVHVTFKELTPEELETNVSNIGLPIPTLTVYIMDQDLHLLPVGVPGELCVGGAGVARGYLNRPELTAEKFVPNPYRPAERLYRSGDLVRRLPSGEMEYLGRIDLQVKIRGFRVELGEIEHHLLTHPEVREAVVLDRVDKIGERYLVAYLVAERPMPIAELRAYLTKDLPDYMVPAQVMYLERLPLTNNGKIDRRALPEPAFDETLRESQNYLPPRDALEAKIAAIWSTVLGLKHVGVRNNFFDLGGHSLNAVKALTSLQQDLRVLVSLRDLFQNPTIEELARVIRERGVTGLAAIPKLPAQAYYRTSYAQQRLWYIHQMAGNSEAYNISGQVTLKEKVDPQLVEQAFKTIIARHDGLRTRFRLQAEGVVQIVDAETHFELEMIDLTQTSDEKAHGEGTSDHLFQTVAINGDIETTKEADAEFTAAQVGTILFDLEKGPLFKVKLVKVDTEQFDLIFAMHHIISDGWSLEVLKREFFTIYEALKTGQTIQLEPLAIQYTDFAAWQNTLLEDGERLQSVKAFWAEMLAGESRVNLPADYGRATLKDHASAGYRFVLPAGVRERLKEIGKAHNASLFMVLLAGFKFLLARLSGEQELLIGIPAAGREHPALRDVIGFFINALVLKSQVDVEATFGYFLDRVQETTLKVLEYQNYPLEMILEELDRKYPELSVFFNMLNIGDTVSYELTDQEARHIGRVQDAKFELVLYLSEYANGIEVNCHYWQGLFKPETVEYFMEMYKRILEGIAVDPDKPMKEYGTAAKKQRVRLG